MRQGGSGGCLSIHVALPTIERHETSLHGVKKKRKAFLDPACLPNLAEAALTRPYSQSWVQRKSRKEPMQGPKKPLPACYGKKPCRVLVEPFW